MRSVLVTVPQRASGATTAEALDSLSMLDDFMAVYKAPGISVCQWASQSQVYVQCDEQWYDRLEATMLSHGWNRSVRTRKGFWSPPGIERERASAIAVAIIHEAEGKPSLLGILEST